MERWHWSQADYDDADQELIDEAMLMLVEEAERRRQERIDRGELDPDDEDIEEG